MLVDRLTFYVKSRRTDKAVEMIKEAGTMVEYPHGSLIYTNFAGEFNAVINEIKFENFTELEEWWAKWGSHPDTPAFLERWYELLQDRSGKREILNLVE